MTRPSSSGCARQPGPQRQERLQHEVVEGATGEGHASGESRGEGGVEPELVLLHPDRRREARVHLGEPEVAQGPTGVVLGGTAQHGHRGPRGERSPGGQRDRLRAVEGDVREEPSVRGHAGLGSTGRRADDERRRLVHRPLTGVPDVVGVRKGAVAWTGHCDLGRSARRAEGSVGVVGRHGVEAGPERGDLVPLRVRPEPACCGQRVLNEGVLLHRRQDDAGLELNRGHEVGRPLHDPVGWLALEVRFFAAAAEPAPSFATHDDHRVVLARCHGREGVVEHLLLRDPDLEAECPRPRRPDAPGHGACRIRERPRALGHRQAIDRAE